MYNVSMCICINLIAIRYMYHCNILQIAVVLDISISKSSLNKANIVIINSTKVLMPLVLVTEPSQTNCSVGGKPGSPGLTGNPLTRAACTFTYLAHDSH